MQYFCLLPEVLRLESLSLCPPMAASSPLKAQQKQHPISYINLRSLPLYQLLGTLQYYNFLSICYNYS